MFQRTDFLEGKELARVSLGRNTYRSSRTGNVLRARVRTGSFYTFSSGGLEYTLVVTVNSRI